MTELLDGNNLGHLLKAGSYLKEGRLVAFPTETVYGLGASIYIPSAIRSIFQTKGRASDNPLIAHISSIQQVQELAVEIPDDFFLLANHFFPGPLTIVLKKHPSISPIVSGGQESIAFRMPNHPIARQLIEIVGEPLVAPSANLSGRPSSTNARHVLDDFHGKIAAVIDGGPSEIGLESTVLSLHNGRPLLLRPGSIRKESLESVLKKTIPILDKKVDPSSPVLSPGLKYRHYAPNAKVLLFYSIQEVLSHCLRTPSKKRLLLSNLPLPSLHYSPLTDSSLYASLRYADHCSCEEVVVFLDPEVLNNIALLNRLERAAE